MQRLGIGDIAYDDYNNPTTRLEELMQGGIEPCEHEEIKEQVQRLVEARPNQQVSAATLRHIGQLAHVGVVRYPLKGAKREIRELVALFIVRMTRRRAA